MRTSDTVQSTAITPPYAYAVEVPAQPKKTEYRQEECLNAKLIY